MGQETPSAPISISDTSLDGVKLTNQSPKGIVAYILKLHYAGLSGAIGSIKFRGGVDPRGPNASWLPGEAWRHPLESSRLKIRGAAPTAPPRVEVTYVLFSDRSSWGTDPRGKYAEGMYIGWRDCSEYLRDLWKQRGIQAVEDYLKSLP